MDAHRPDEKYYTLEDYLALGEDTRAEIIDGKLYMMAAPHPKHQFVLLEIAAWLREFFKGKPCQPFVSPFAVALRKNPRETQIFEPDIVVICDFSKLNGVYRGAPEFVIEIVSPSTSQNDYLKKLLAYQRAGVKEYWIVNYENEAVHVNTLDDRGFYECAEFGGTDTVPVSVFPGLQIDMKSVFDAMRERWNDGRA